MTEITITAETQSILCEAEDLEALADDRAAWPDLEITPLSGDRLAVTGRATRVKAFWAAYFAVDSFDEAVAAGWVDA